MTDIRAEAAKAVADVIQGQAFDSNRLSARLRNASAGDLGLYRELSFGTLRHFHLLDASVALHLKKPLPNKHSAIRALLAIGCYQLFFMRTPDYAALSATVDATRTLKKQWASGMVNAVLRKLLRETEGFGSPSHQSLKAYARSRHLADAVIQSQPEWLFNSLSAQYGESVAEIAEHNNSAPVMTLRLSKPAQRQDYSELLASTDISAVANPLVSSALTLDSASDVNELPGFSEGEVSVQDAAAQLVPELLELSNGDRVLDACAAPGGKTLALLQHAANRGCELAEVTAIDISPQRLQQVEQNLARAKQSAKLIAADAASIDEWWDGELFQKILLDAPCSGTGVINRHPDIKLLRRQSDIAGFAAQQSRLLSNNWPLLDSGGMMLYCTCSILAEENQAVIRAFLQQHDDAMLEKIEEDWGFDTGYGRQLLPNKGINDGFFFAKIRKCPNG